jgi:uncharacterized repeat protein (TIGR01451 family)
MRSQHVWSRRYLLISILVCMLLLGSASVSARFDPRATLRPGAPSQSAGGQTAGDPNALGRPSSIGPLNHEIVIGFDQDAAGNDIPRGIRIKEQYAALGVHFNRNRNDAFYTARRLISYRNYKTTTTLNLLCTVQGASAKPPAGCHAPDPPAGGTIFTARLVVDLDFPVYMASIEGRTRADGVEDSDSLRMQAFDANGKLLDDETALCSNNPSHTKEGVCIPVVRASGIRRIVIMPGEGHQIDALDTLRLWPEHIAPDLAIGKDDGQTSVVPGQVLTYTLTIRNLSAQDATGVVVSDTLPDYTAFSSASDGGDVGGKVVTWPAFDLAAGGSTTRSVTVQMDARVPAGVETITNTATVADDGANGPDPTPGNNTASDTDTVVAAPDLAIIKDDGQTSVVPGQVLTYTLTIRNVGDQDATGVKLTDTLPISTSFSSASDGGSAAGDVVTWPAFDLAAGGSTTRSVTVKVDPLVPAEIQTITNTATVADDGANGPDPVPENNTASDTDALAICRIYAVHDAGQSDSQFFTLDLRDLTTRALGPLYAGLDSEALDEHPLTGVLYATGKGQDGKDLLIVDRQSGALTRIGQTGFQDVDALSFRSTDATLWGWSRGTGLIQIDLTTGAGTLVFRSDVDIEGLAWSNDGSGLYASSGKQLYLYDPIQNKLAQIAANLPGETEGLEMRPDGLLALAVDGSTTIFAYDVSTMELVPSQGISIAPYNDVEGIAWPAWCGAMP